MTSPISNQCHRQVPLRPGGRRSVSIGGGRSSSLALLRPPRAAPINPTLSLSVSTKPNHNPPLWLLVSDQTLDLPDRYPFHCVSVADNKILKPSENRLPWDDEFFFPDDTVVYHSSPLGWVLMKNPRTQQMFLVNPLFPSDTAVPLPPIYNLNPTFVGGSVTKSSGWSSRLCTNYIFVEEETESWSGLPKKPELQHYAIETLLYFCPTFAMSSVPSDSSCIVLMQNAGLIGFWKPGHKCWNIVKEPNTGYDGQNIVYSDANQCFYVLDTSGDKASVEGWRWDTEYDPEPRRISLVEASSPRPYPGGDVECKRYADCWHKVKLQYLVESPCGNLLLVERFYSFNSDKDEKEEDDTFFVFELNLELRKWGHVKSLGGSNSLLLGSDYALCVDADNYRELKPNCIYLDKGVVFNVDDASIHPNYFMRDHRGPSIWLLPNPNS